MRDGLTFEQPKHILRINAYWYINRALVWQTNVENKDMCVTPSHP